MWVCGKGAQQGQIVKVKREELEMKPVEIVPKGRRLMNRAPRVKGKSAVTASPRTIAFKEHIQQTLAASGIEVNRNLAWQIYKDVIYATCAFTLKDSEKRLPLSGVGTFTIRESVPRKGKADEYNYVPRLKFKPSSRISALLEEALPECRKDFTEAKAAASAKGKAAVAKKVAKPAPVVEEEEAPVAKKAAKKAVAKAAPPAKKAVKKAAPVVEEEDEEEDLEEPGDEDDDDEDGDDEDAGEEGEPDFDFEG